LLIGYGTRGEASREVVPSIFGIVAMLPLW